MFTMVLQAPGGWIDVPFWLVALSVGCLVTGGLIYLAEQLSGRE
jgi:hypothetical protein